MAEFKSSLETLFSDTQSKVLSLVFKEGIVPYDLTLKKTDYYFTSKENQEMFNLILKSLDVKGAIDLSFIKSKIINESTLNVFHDTLKIESDEKEFYKSVSLLKECAVRSQLITMSNQWVNSLYSFDNELSSSIDEFETRLAKEVSNLFNGQNTDIKSALEQLIQELQVNNELKGIPSGFVNLDRITLGWQRSSLITLASRPSMGKTSLAVNFMVNSAISFGFPVVFFSMELGLTNLMNKVVSCCSKVHQSRLRSNNLEETDWQRLVSETIELAKSKIHIDDSPGLRISDLRSRIRAHVRLNGVELVIIDNMQLIVNPTTINHDDVDEELKSIALELRSLAKELNIPILVLCNLDRKLETRGGDKRPQLDDLLGEDYLEHYSDQILFLYRPEYYGITQDENGLPTKGLAEVIVAKNRAGDFGYARLKFEPEFAKFSDFVETPF